MITLGKTYSSDMNASEQIRPVVLYRSSEVNNSKVNSFVVAVLMVVSVSVLSLQTGFVLNANAQDNPISSPISTQESPTPAPTSNPANNNNGNNSGGNGSGGSSNNSGGSSSASCNNEAPKAPRIVSATSANKNEVTLYWEKAQGSVTHYAISYGLLKGKPLYGVTNIGNVTSYTVKGLSAGVTYFFNVSAVNECAAGPASNEIGIKGGGKFINAPAVGFKRVVAGKTLTKTVPTVKIIQSPQPIKFNFESSNTLNPGLIGKAVSFIKGFFN